MSRELFDRLVDELEPCRRVLADAEQERGGASPGADTTPGTATASWPPS